MDNNLKELTEFVDGMISCFLLLMPTFVISFVVIYALCYFGVVK